MRTSQTQEQELKYWTYLVEREGHPVDPPLPALLPRNTGYTQTFNGVWGIRTEGNLFFLACTKNQARQFYGFWRRHLDHHQL